MAWHFISYAREDGAEFALKLYDELLRSPEGFKPWLDQHDIENVDDWDFSIERGIRRCRSLIFILTSAASHDDSGCRDELEYARTYKKPVIVVIADAKARKILTIVRRQHIDFTGSFDQGLAELRASLRDLGTTASMVEQYEAELSEYEARREGQPRPTPRLDEAVDALREEIDRLRRIEANLEESERQADDRIARALERRRLPTPRGSQIRRSESDDAEEGARVAPKRLVRHRPPIPLPPLFLDRDESLSVLRTFLVTEGQRLCIVSGRGGVGKTALACHLLQQLEKGHRSSAGADVDWDGIVYRSQSGAAPITAHGLLQDLRRFLDAETGHNLDDLLRSDSADITLKIGKLLSCLDGKRIYILLDNFEDLVAPETGTIAKRELLDFFTGFLREPRHSAKIILTTRETPADLVTISPAAIVHEALDAGLPAKDAATLLRSLDATNVLGLKDAPDALLHAIAAATRGYPRALNAFVGALHADPTSSAEELIARVEALDDMAVTEALVGEAFSRLRPDDQLVLQAVAAYNGPIDAPAIDYVMRTFRPGIDTAPILRRLARARFLESGAEGYALHPIDRRYALGRLDPGDGSNPELHQPTRRRMQELAADFLAQSRKPRSTWRSLEDIRGQLQELDLRVQVGDLDAAYNIIDSIYKHLEQWGHYELLAELINRIQMQDAREYVQSGLLKKMATVAWRRGDLIEAIRNFQRASEIEKASGDEFGAAIQEANVAIVREGLGLFRTSLASLRRFFQMHSRDMSLDNERIIYGHLSECYEELGELDEALDLSAKAFKIAGGLEPDAREAQSHNLGSRMKTI